MVKENLRHLVQSKITVWRERATRLEAKIVLNVRDKIRDFVWYIGGGRQFFERYFP